MSAFESELKKGRFVVCQCTSCSKITWPPNDFCSSCFGSISVRDIKEPGIIIECSAKDGKRFCLAEFEGVVRIIGTMTGPEPKPGQKVRISSCAYEGDPKFVFSAA